METHNYLWPAGGVFPMNKLSLVHREIGSIIAQFIHGRVGKDLTESDYILTYHVGRGDKINFGDCLIHNLIIDFI